MHEKGIYQRESKTMAAAHRPFSSRSTTQFASTFVDNRSEAHQQQQVIDAVSNSTILSKGSPGTHHTNSTGSSTEPVQMNSDLLLSLAYYLGVDGTANAVALALGISPSTLWFGLNAIGAIALTWGAQEIIDWFWARGFGGPQETTTTTMDIEETRTETVHPATMETEKTRTETLHPATMDTEVTTTERVYPATMDTEVTTTERVHPATMDTEETRTLVRPAPPIPKYRPPHLSGNRRNGNRRKNRDRGNNRRDNDRRNAAPTENQIDLTRAATKHNHTRREIVAQIRRGWANRRGPNHRYEITIPWGEGAPQGIILIVKPDNRYLVKHAQSAENIRASRREQERNRNHRAAQGDSASTNNDWRNNKFH